MMLPTNFIVVTCAIAAQSSLAQDVCTHGACAASAKEGMSVHGHSMLQIADQASSGRKVLQNLWSAPPQAPTNQTTSGPVEFNLQHKSGKCIHPSRGTDTPNNDEALIFYDGCNPTRDALLFKEIPGQSDYFVLQHQSGKCVHPANGADNPNNGVGLVFWDGCNTDRDALLFKKLPAPSDVLSDFFVLQHKSGKCVHPANGANIPDNGVGMVFWDDCNIYRDGLVFKEIPVAQTLPATTSEWCPKLLPPVGSTGCFMHLPSGCPFADATTSLSDTSRDKFTSYGWFKPKEILQFLTYQSCSDGVQYLGEKVCGVPDARFLFYSLSWREGVVFGKAAGDGSSWCKAREFEGPYQLLDGSQFNISGTTIELIKGWNVGGKYTISRMTGNQFSVSGGYGWGGATYTSTTINFYNGIVATRVPNFYALDLCGDYVDPDGKIYFIYQNADTIEIRLVGPWRAGVSAQYHGVRAKVLNETAVNVEGKIFSWDGMTLKHWDEGQQMLSTFTRNINDPYGLAYASKYLGYSTNGGTERCKPSFLEGVYAFSDDEKDAFTVSGINAWNYTTDEVKEAWLQFEDGYLAGEVQSRAWFRGESMCPDKNDYMVYTSNSIICEHGAVGSIYHRKYTAYRRDY